MHIFWVVVKLKKVEIGVEHLRQLEDGRFKKYFKVHKHSEYKNRRFILRVRPSFII